MQPVLVLHRIAPAQYLMPVLIPNAWPLCKLALPLHLVQAAAPV